MDADVIRDLFREFGPVDIRRMFGGVGLFVDGLMIAIITRDDTIYLKADEATIAAFESEGLAPFSYNTKHGEHKLTSYWRMPERLYDDTEELARWARDAHAVAKRKAARAPRSNKLLNRASTEKRAPKARTARSAARKTAKKRTKRN